MTVPRSTTPQTAAHLCLLAMLSQLSGSCLESRIPVASTPPAEPAASTDSPTADDPPPLRGLLAARAGFHTSFPAQRAPGAQPAKSPPGDEMLLVTYPGPTGPLAAYLTAAPNDDNRHPAVIWAHGGFGGIGEWLWQEAPLENDQSVRAFLDAGLVVMCPSWRGENDNPGSFELFLGEVEDLIAARAHLASLPWVDPDRIYLLGHSTGGTLALLTAEAATDFRAIISFGGQLDLKSFDDYVDHGVQAPELAPDALAQELRMRSPLEHVGGITSPTYYFEGEVHSDESSQKRMTQRAEQAGVPFTATTIADADHFDILAPLTHTLAELFLADTGSTFALDPERLTASYHRSLNDYPGHTIELPYELGQIRFPRRPQRAIDEQAAASGLAVTDLYVEHGPQRLSARAVRFPQQVKSLEAVAKQLESELLRMADANMKLVSNANFRGLPSRRLHGELDGAPLHMRVIVGSTGYLALTVNMQPGASEVWSERFLDGYIPPPAAAAR